MNIYINNLKRIFGEEVTTKDDILSLYKRKNINIKKQCCMYCSWSGSMVNYDICPKCGKELITYYEKVT